MNEYTDRMRSSALFLGETTDRITLDPLAIFDPTAPRHSTVALEAVGRIQYWDTGALHAWVSQNPVHPSTRRPLTPAEIAYINHYQTCLTLEENIDWAPIVVYRNFIQCEGILTGVSLLAARALLSPRNFADHFQDYQPLDDNTIRYERTQAEAYLRNVDIGKWLLRHSSKARPDDPCERDLINHLGLEYYAISYTVDSADQEYTNFSFNAGDPWKKIVHVLILHRPGWGWARIGNTITYFNNSVQPSFAEGREKYHVCFIDVLLSITRQLGLQFKNHIGGYID